MGQTATGRCHRAGHSGNRTGGWWDLGRGARGQEERRLWEGCEPGHLLSRGSFPEIKTARPAGSKVRVSAGLGHTACAGRGPGRALGLPEPLFQMCEDDGTCRLCPSRAVAASPPRLAGTGSGCAHQNW